MTIYPSELKRLFDEEPDPIHLSAHLLQKVRTEPESSVHKPRTAAGMGQLIEPDGTRNVIGTATWCIEYCAEYPGWSWEQL
jgi:hypothetical protein